MEILKSIDLYFLSTLFTILVIFSVFYAAALRKQKMAWTKINEVLKRQEQTNQQLNSVITELKRSNRYLAELAEMETVENSVENMPNTTAVTDNQYKLYVGNIDYTATEAELASHFANQGRVVGVNIPVNRYNGKTRGFGFVTFGSREEAEQAISLHGTEFKGRQIQVNFAKERDGSA